MNLIAKRLAFFWTLSFLCAVVGYYFLDWLTPGEIIFGEWGNGIPIGNYIPLDDIFIACIVYGLLANISVDIFYNSKLGGRIFLYLLILVGVTLISSFLGGMLSVQVAMFYIPDWALEVLRGGFDGLSVGWFIVLLSFPYNVLIIVLGFFITQYGAKLFHKKDQEIQLENKKEELPNILDDNLK